MKKIKSKNLDAEELIKIIKNRFCRDFNEIPLSLLERAYPRSSLSEKVIYPSGKGEILYPFWTTLFEARTLSLGRMLKHDVDKLADVGIYLMKIDGLRTMMFITGCGYDFYERHWLPLYKDILKLI